MTATANDRFVSIAATAGQTVLAYDFPLTAASAITVIRVRAGAQTTLTHGGGDFTFPSGLGSASGGTLTLASAALADDVYYLIGALAEERSSDFVGSQAFDVDKFNAQLDALVLIAQEHRRDIGRALKGEYGTTPANLPAAAAGRYLGWNGAGTALENKVLAAEGDVEISLDEALSSTDDLVVPAVKTVKAHLEENYQPLDSDLTAIALLSTTAFGRALLTLADAASGRTALELGAVATRAVATFGEYNSATATRALGNESVWADLAVLTDGATIAVDMNAGYDFGGASNAALALGGNRTLGAPTNVRNGKKGILWFTASGSTRTLTLNAAWVLASGVETGPYSITTSQTVGVAYACRGTAVVVTAIVRVG